MRDQIKVNVVPKVTVVPNIVSTHKKLIKTFNTKINKTSKRT